uniref:N/A n=1 Tax=Ganoderma boninense TaxID=34458 RepID=A0A5K1K4L3_9APHY|nr:N/A [Ganoderma boninense]
MSTGGCHKVGSPLPTSEFAPLPSIATLHRYRPDPLLFPPTSPDFLPAIHIFLAARSESRNLARKNPMSETSDAHYIVGPRQPRRQSPPPADPPSQNLSSAKFISYVLGRRIYVDAPTTSPSSSIPRAVVVSEDLLCALFMQAVTWSFIIGFIRRQGISVAHSYVVFVGGDRNVPQDRRDLPFAFPFDALEDVAQELPRELAHERLTQALEDCKLYVDDYEVSLRRWLRAVLLSSVVLAVACAVYVFMCDVYKELMAP